MPLFVVYIGIFLFVGYLVYQHSMDEENNHKMLEKKALLKARSKFEDKILYEENEIPLVEQFEFESPEFKKLQRDKYLKTRGMNMMLKELGGLHAQKFTQDNLIKISEIKE